MLSNIIGISGHAIYRDEGNGTRNFRDSFTDTRKSVERDKSDEEKKNKDILVRRRLAIMI